MIGDACPSETRIRLRHFSDEVTGGDVIIIGPDGTHYRLGDKIMGNASGSAADEIEADYGGLPTACGPPPWLVLHHGLAPYRATGS